MKRIKIKIKKIKMSTQEIMEYFNRTRITILNWRKRGCPSHKEKREEYGTRNSVYFYIDEVTKWVGENITR
jgi:hypothetical protein